MNDQINYLQSDNISVGRLHRNPQNVLVVLVFHRQISATFQQ